ncbi:hypothetical protein E2562_012560 [Oryza meyeriana var. granulata]|uniref:Uncharacterized protein n=1 Tax=Oryza meyeriana var. granulata TaxID=110450 RepID=A0A6G1D3P2_9ORYZ|nr:hypothetical protein E2562_012560 [Oryza meyeriana var. granulata]
MANLAAPARLLPAISRGSLLPPAVSCAPPFPLASILSHASSPLLRLNRDSIAGVQHASPGENDRLQQPGTTSRVPAVAATTARNSATTAAKGCYVTNTTTCLTLGRIWKQQRHNFIPSQGNHWPVLG